MISSPYGLEKWTFFVVHQFQKPIQRIKVEREREKKKINEC